jgi:hypothetical protein
VLRRLCQRWPREPSDPYPKPGPTVQLVVDMAALGAPRATSRLPARRSKQRAHIVSRNRARVASATPNAPISSWAVPDKLANSVWATFSDYTKRLRRDPKS